MIDIQNESVLTLAQAADELPRRRRGRKTHVSTLFRWTTTGCRGVRLESVQVGGSRCTSREALQRFCEKLSDPAPAPAPGRPGRTINQRLRASAEAAKKLESMGA